MPRDADGLTPRQALFAREYLIDHNGEQAAIRAGYTQRSARVTASKMLANPNIRKVVDRGASTVAGRLGITAEKVLGGLAKIAYEEPGVGAGARIKAGELLGKHLKLFTERHEIAGDGGTPLTVRVIYVGADDGDGDDDGGRADTPGLPGSP